MALPRLSVDVSEDLHSEIKVYTSLTPGTSIQSVITQILLEFLAQQATQAETRYAVIANKELLANYIREIPAAADLASE